LFLFSHSPIPFPSPTPFISSLPGSFGKVVVSLSPQALLPLSSFFSPRTIFLSSPFLPSFFPPHFPADFSFNCRESLVLFLPQGTHPCWWYLKTLASRFVSFPCHLLFPQLLPFRSCIPRIFFLWGFRTVRNPPPEFSFLDFLLQRLLFKRSTRPSLSNAR